MTRINLFPIHGRQQWIVPAFWLVIFYFIVSLIVSIILRANTASTDGFFAELGNVSAAVASGEGFANVFDPTSGPTAWCPVLNVLCYAAVFKIFGIKSTAAFWALILIRCVLFSAALWWLLKLDYSSRLNSYKILLVPIFLAYTILVIYRTGPKDSMFSVFFSILTVYVLLNCWKKGYANNRWPLFVLAGVLPLTNISLSIGLMTFIVVGFILRPGMGSLSTGALLVMTLIASFTVWGVRNKAELGKFIPYKSNLWFEMYISNVVDNDGLLKYSNYRKLHPYTNKAVASIYKEQGEVTFLDKYQRESIEYLKSNPGEFILKILNRSFNIFIFAKSERDIEPADVDLFNSEDLEALERAQLVVDNYWVCLESSPGEISNTLEKLNLSNPEVIIQDWQNKRTTTQQRVNNTNDINELIKGLTTSIVPSLAIIIGLLVRVIRTNLTYIFSIILFLLSIGPYLVISWTPRYQSFQIGFFTIFVFMVTAWILDTLGPTEDTPIEQHSTS